MRPKCKIENSDQTPSKTKRNCLFPELMGAKETCQNLLLAIMGSINFHIPSIIGMNKDRTQTLPASIEIR